MPEHRPRITAFPWRFQAVNSEVWLHALLARAAAYRDFATPCDTASRTLFWKPTMIRNRPLMLPQLLPLLVLCVTVGACERFQPPSQDSSPAADCPGATAAEAEQDYHPRILRGRVHAPNGELAREDDFFDKLIPAAHAAPLEEEQPVAGANVALYLVGSDGERRGEVLQHTSTDPRGEWCMKLPDGTDFGAQLIAEASREDTVLRRSVVSEFATDIYSTSEALTRLLQARDVDFTEISDQSYFNLESIAATAVDLLDPVELTGAEQLEPTVEKIGQTLRDDPRLSAKIDQLR